MSIYLQKNSTIFWMDFWFAGTRIRESTNTNDKLAAMAVEYERKWRLREDREIESDAIFCGWMDMRRIILERPGDSEIYVIGIEGQPFIKIGRSRVGNTAIRCSHLQVSVPNRLTILGVIQYVAESVESAFHEEFRMFHHRGEWFKRDARMMRTLKRLFAINVLKERKEFELRRYKNAKAKEYARRDHDELLAVPMEAKRAAMEAIRFYTPPAEGQL